MIDIKILVNCALPYANGPLHVGHIAGAYMGADIFVRFQRMMGNEVLYVSGTDEYGTPITVRADKEGISPKEIADKYHEEFIRTFKNLDINFDIFTRTTYEEHAKIVGDFFLDLYNKGFISKGTMISPYCKKIGRFMPDRYIEGKCPYCGYENARGDQCDNCGRTLDPQELINPVCILSGERPEFRETEHFFLRLDLFQEKLLEWLGTKKFWKPNVLEYTKNFISSGLKERAITRDIDWGVKIPLPGYEHKRIYVWFEALIGYISGAAILSNERGKPDYWKEFYFNKDVPSYYFIGKDNIPFHSIIWPAMLMGREGINLPYDIPANEYLTFKGEQFSKSRGVGYSVDDLLRIVDKDYLRFYVASILPETGDSDFSLENLADVVNSDLIDKYGNFVHRTLSFINKYNMRIRVPERIEDKDPIEYAERILSDYISSLEGVKVKKALSSWLELVIYSNVFFNRSEPWKLVKSDPDACNEKMYISLRLIQFLTAMIHPYVPASSEKIWALLGLDHGIEDSLKHIKEVADFKIGFSEPPFQKIEPGSLNL